MINLNVYDPLGNFQKQIGWKLKKRGTESVCWHWINKKNNRREGI